MAEEENKIILYTTDGGKYDRRREVAGFAPVAGWAHLAEPNGATAALIPVGAL